MAQVLTRRLLSGAASHLVGTLPRTPPLVLGHAARATLATAARPRKRGLDGSTRSGHGESRGHREDAAPVDPWRLAELRGRVAELPADFENPARLAALSSRLHNEWGVHEAPLQAAVQLALVERYADKPCFTPGVISALVMAVSRSRLPQRVLSEQVLVDSRWALLLDTISRSLRLEPEEWDLRSLSTVLYALHRLTPPTPDAAMQGLLQAAGTLLPVLASGRVDYYDSVSLVQCLFALSRWRLAQPGVFRALAPTVMRQLEAHTDQGLCMLLQAYGHAQVSVPELMSAALDVILPRLPGFSQQGVSIVLWALYRQRDALDLDESCRATLHTAALEAVREGSPSTLTHVAQACAALGLLDGPLLRALEQRACATLPDIRGRSLSTIALAAAGAPGAPSALPGLLLNRVADDPSLCLDVDYAGVLIAQAVSPTPSAPGVLQLLYKLRERGTLQRTDSMVFLAGALYAMARMQLASASTSAPLSDLVLGGNGHEGAKARAGERSNAHATGRLSDAISSALPLEVAFTYQGVFDQVTAMDWHNLQRVPASQRAAARRQAAAASAEHVEIKGSSLWDSLVQRLHAVLCAAEAAAQAPPPEAASPYAARTPPASTPAHGKLTEWTVRENWFALGAAPTASSALLPDEGAASQGVDWRTVHIPRVLYAIGEAARARAEGSLPPAPATEALERELVLASAASLPHLDQPLSAPSALVCAHGMAAAGVWDPAAWEYVLGRLAPAVDAAPSGPQLASGQVILWGPRPGGATPPSSRHAPKPSKKQAAKEPSDGSGPEQVSLAAAEVRRRREAFNKWYVDGTWALTAAVAEGAGMQWAGPQPVKVRRRMQRQVAAARKAVDDAATSQTAAVAVPATSAALQEQAVMQAAAGVAAPSATHAEQHPIVFGTLPRQSDMELLQGVRSALLASPLAHLADTLPGPTAGQP